MFSFVFNASQYAGDRRLLFRAVCLHVSRTYIIIAETKKSPVANNNSDDPCSSTAMGIPDAGRVYENTYGPGGRVILDGNIAIAADQCDRDIITRPRTHHYSLDMMDLPTYSVALISMLGKEIAGRISTSFGRDGAHLGQMIVFYERVTGNVLETLYDEQAILQDDDMKAINFASNAASSDAAILRNAMTTSSTTLATTREYYQMVKQYGKNAASITAVKRVPVLIPNSLDAVNELVDHDNVKANMMPPPSGEGYHRHNSNYESVSQWLDAHGNIKRRHFITNRHIYSAKDGASNRYLNAYYAGELEGLILLYAHRAIRMIKKKLKSASEQGRCLILFVDGLAPAIKKATRLKRQNRQDAATKRIIDESLSLGHNRSADDMTSALLAACERFVMKIPLALLTCVLLDVMRIPFVRQVGAKELYLSPSFYSEAEDDIVRLISNMAGLETPVKHFAISDKKVLIDHDTECPNTKQPTTWSKLTDVMEKHTVAEQKQIDCNLFSHDSDVLTKWNLLVSHHRQVCVLLNRPASSSAVKFGGCKFFRSKHGGSPSKVSGVGGKLFARSNPIEETVYDLTESPLQLSPESTLLVMLTKGSDYNTSLVSPGTHYDSQIRTEATMFERMTCTCVSGWREYFDTISASKDRKDAAFSDIDDMGTISTTNLSNKPCGKCMKYLVLPYWATKFFFAAQATDFVNTKRHIFFPPSTYDEEEKCANRDTYDMHAALAVNAAANVMACLTMGSYNQRVFGSMTASSKRIVSMICGHRDGADYSLSPVDAEAVAKKNSQPAVNNDPTGAKKRKGDNNIMSDKARKRKANAPPIINHEISMAVVRSRREFFDKHTQGGIPFEDEAVRNDKAAIFGDVFPGTPIRNVVGCEPSNKKDNINNNNNNCQLSSDVFDSLFSNSMGVIREESGEAVTVIDDAAINSTKSNRPWSLFGAIVGDDDDDDNNNNNNKNSDNNEDGEGCDWLSKAANAFASRTEEEDKACLAEFNSWVSKASARIGRSISPKMNDDDNNNNNNTDAITAIGNNNNDNNNHNNSYVAENEIDWAHLSREFAHCLSASNVKFTAGSIISTLSGILTNIRPVKGVDDDRINGLPYSIKTMNLLVIIYLNMCGLQDPNIVNTLHQGQLIPVIHQEYCSAHANNRNRVVVGGGKDDNNNNNNNTNSNFCNTDRDNFMAAALEFIFLCYGPEVGQKSRIMQAKRHNWGIPDIKLQAHRNVMETCIKNCYDAIEDSNPSSSSISEKIWMPGRGFMPVMGVTVAKPWTPLGLWSSFLSHFSANNKFEPNNITNNSNAVPLPYYGGRGPPSADRCPKPSDDWLGIKKNHDHGTLDSLARLHRS